ncbi:MAG: nitroreductase family protein [Candidatus Thorarchaeota archaeon]
MEKDTPFLDIVRTRKSIRRFSEKKVPLDLISKIIEVGTYAPTPCNQQLWNFVVVTENQVKEQLIESAGASTIIKRASAVIVVMYDNWSHNEAIQSSSLAVQNILLAATYFKVGTLPMNSFGSAKKIKRILSIPDNQDICCFILLGYPERAEVSDPPIRRRPVDEVFHINRFDKRRTRKHNSYNPEDWSLQTITEHQRYYCRKTTLGKEMDISNRYEKALARSVLKKCSGPLLDILTYDGAYLNEFPSTCEIHCVDLSEETSNYTKAAFQTKLPDSNNAKSFHIYDPNSDSFRKDFFSSSTLIYKAERIPRNIQKKMLDQVFNSLKNEGEFLVVFRRSSLLFSLFYNVIRVLFGNDTRKTGIYAFFGPYKPIGDKQLKRDLKHAGFQILASERFFFIPPFFEEALQMFLVFRKSGGTTYLHRRPVRNILTRLLGFLIKVQGFRRSRFGAITVIRAQKP